MSEWRPIDSCPDTGEWFLVMVPRYSVPAVMRRVGPGSSFWENFWTVDVHDNDTPTHWIRCPTFEELFS